MEKKVNMKNRDRNVIFFCEADTENIRVRKKQDFIDKFKNVYSI